MPAKKTRVPIPDELAAEVMFAADRTCCICHVSGKQVQIHHIDDDPSHNEFDNLAVLCLECHAETQFVGGFSRKLNANLVRRYRTHWLTVVQLRRDAEALRTELERVDSVCRTSSRVELSSPVEAPSPAEDSLVSTRGPKTTAIQAGESFRNGDIVVSVLDVRVSTAIPLKGDGFDAPEVSAGPASKYVLLQTRVFNDGKESIGLSSNCRILNYAVDRRGRKFDSIDKLYKFPGNMKCGDRLQPGFEGDMTWIYLVTHDAEIVGFEFRDASDWEVRPPTQVTLPSPLS